MERQPKQWIRKKDNLKILFIFLLFQWSVIQVFSQNSLTKQDSVFCLNFKLDSTKIKGTYWISDTRSNLVIDSSGFDNARNFKRDEIQFYFDKYGRKLNAYDLQTFLATIFRIGNYIRRDDGGYIVYGCCSVIGDELHPESFRSVCIGSERAYKGNTLVRELCYDSTGCLIGQQLFYYDNGSPKIFYNLSIDPQRGFQLTHGPSIVFYKNGRIKLIQIYEYGSPIYVKRYNRFGIRTYYKKFGET